jgi:hypothetical protein
LDRLFVSMRVKKTVAVLCFDPIDLPRIVVANAPFGWERLDGVPFEVFHHIISRDGFSDVQIQRESSGACMN